MAANREMKKTDETIRGQAREELLKARELEAARADARLAVRDLATLRLFALKQEVRPYVEAMPEARGLIDLTLSGGYPPRLWIDLTSFVLIGEDNRTWRLMQDSQEERACLFESDDLQAMAKALRRFIAQRVVHRAHMLPASPQALCQGDGGAPQSQPRNKEHDGGMDGGLLWLAWLAGVVSGALALMAWLVHMGKLS